MKKQSKILISLILVLAILFSVNVYAENENPNVRSIKPDTAKTAIVTYEETDPYIRNTTQYTAIKMLVDIEEPYALLDWFTHIKFYYDQGYYTDADVRVFVEKGKITPAQYTQITGQPY